MFESAKYFQRLARFAGFRCRPVLWFCGYVMAPFWPVTEPRKTLSARFTVWIRLECL
jgi:hypothetical protein